MRPRSRRYPNPRRQRRIRTHDRPSRIIAATVYQGTALITREVTVPAGTGLIELLVSPLPEQTADTSLYTDGADGVRVLSTRFRSRAVQADTR